MKTSVFPIIFKILLFVVLGVVYYKVTLSPVFAGCCPTVITCSGSCKDTPIGCAKSALATMRECPGTCTDDVCSKPCSDLTTWETFSTCDCTPADCASPTSTPSVPTSTPIPPTPTPMPPSGECDSNCRDVPDSTCHGGTCGICQKRTNIHQCD